MSVYFGENISHFSIAFVDIYIIISAQNLVIWIILGKESESIVNAITKHTELFLTWKQSKIFGVNNWHGYRYNYSWHLAINITQKGHCPGARCFMLIEGVILSNVFAHARWICCPFFRVTACANESVDIQCVFFVLFCVLFWKRKWKRKRRNNNNCMICRNFFCLNFIFILSMLISEYRIICLNFENEQL